VNKLNFFVFLQKVIEGLMSENANAKATHQGGRIPEGPSPTALPELPGNARLQTVKGVVKQTRLASESELHLPNGDTRHERSDDVGTVAADVHVQQSESHAHRMESAPRQNHGDLRGVHHVTEGYPRNVIGKDQDTAYISNHGSVAATHSANVTHDEESWQIVDPKLEENASRITVGVASEKEAGNSSAVLQDAMHEALTHADERSTSTFRHAPNPPSSQNVDGNIHRTVLAPQQETNTHVTTNHATTTHTPPLEGATVQLKDTNYLTETPPLLSAQPVPDHDSATKIMDSSQSAAPAGIQPASSVEHAAPLPALSPALSPTLAPVSVAAQVQGLHTAAAAKQPNAARREAPPPRPFPPEVLAHPGDKELQITLRHLDHPPVPTAPAVLTLLDTIWGVVSLRGVRSIFGSTSRPQQDDDFLPSPWR
jgi:hypothetical protein